MRRLEVDFVITVDRSMMSDHHGKEFIGFVATGPPVLFPEKVWMWIAAPKPRVDKYGRPHVAPYGLRKIEAALLEAGFSAAIIDPDYIGHYVAHAKAVLIGHHDYFAFNPPSSEWWLLTGYEPVNRRSFMRFAKRLARLKRELNPELRIIVGGPAAWQWLYVPRYIREYSVDTIVEGEAEEVIVEIAERIVQNKPLPRYVSVAPRDSPPIEKIPVIRGASVNGLVEIMRGCPRGCRFCSVTLRPLRFIPLDKIEAEILVNVRAGLREGILHSEDVLLYGAEGVIPRPKPLISLHRLAKKHYEVVGWSHVSLAAVVAAQERYKLITKLTNEILYDDKQSYIGVQTGIETGSRRLAKIIMPAKAAPYPAEAWPEIVEEAFSIMYEHNIIPAATVIIGLPGEKRDDIVETIELVDRLKSYRSLIVPMFFVPMGRLKDENWFLSINITYEHAELLIRLLRHTAYWAKDILQRYYMKGIAYAPLRFLLARFVNRALAFAESLTPEKLLQYVEEARERMSKKSYAEEPLVKPLHQLVRAVHHHLHRGG